MIFNLSQCILDGTEFKLITFRFDCALSQTFINKRFRVFTQVDRPVVFCTDLGKLYYVQKTINFEYITIYSVQAYIIIIHEGAF